MIEQVQDVGLLLTAVAGVSGVSKTAENRSSEVLKCHDGTVSPEDQQSQLQLL